MEGCVFVFSFISRRYELISSDFASPGTGCTFQSIANLFRTLTCATHRLLLSLPSRIWFCRRLSRLLLVFRSMDFLEGKDSHGDYAIQSVASMSPPLAVVARLTCMHLLQIPRSDESARLGSFESSCRWSKASSRSNCSRTWISRVRR